MTSFTDSEKVEYALKTTLNITMSKFGYAPFNETPAPPRVFPSNVMSKDLITYGEGDVDENGAYVSGHSQSGNIDTSLTTYESVLKYYKIVCPVTNKVSKAQLSNVLGATSSQNILGREIVDIDFSYSGGGSGSATSSNFWTQPVNSNFHRLSFFRGHYIDENNSSNKFNHANTHYKGLNLAWNHIADGTDVSAAIDADGNGTDVTKIVPHLKLFLQVQTAFQIGADNKENQCFGHSMMKNMLGLDFKIPVQVNVGEVSSGDTVNASSTSDITGPGIASGNEWYTQSTAGTINFYAVGHSGTKVDNAKDPISYPLNSNAPLVTFLKYTGDHAGVSGLGGGGGGGGGDGGTASSVSYDRRAKSYNIKKVVINASPGNGGVNPGRMRDGYLFFYTNSFGEPRLLLGQGYNATNSRNDGWWFFIPGEGATVNSGGIQTFTSLGAGGGAQAYHSPGVMYKNKFMFLGGYFSPNYYNNLYGVVLKDFSTPVRSSEITSDTDMPSNRYGACGAVNDNIWYIFGGRNSSNNDLNDLYYINLDNYSDRGLITPSNGVYPTGRRGAQIGYYKNCLYLYGGAGASAFTDIFWKFDLTTNNWEEITLFTNSDTVVPQIGWAGQFVGNSNVVGNEMYIVYGNMYGTIPTGFYYPNGDSPFIYTVNLDTYELMKLNYYGNESDWGSSYNYAAEQMCCGWYNNKLYCYGGYKTANISDFIIIDFNKGSYVTKKHELIKDDTFKTKDWRDCYQYAIEKGGNLPESIYIKNNRSTFIQDGKDQWVPCWYRYDEQHKGDWIQIGNLNHAYGTLHKGNNAQNANWGFNENTSYEFKDIIIIDYDTGQIMDKDLILEQGNLNIMHGDLKIEMGRLEVFYAQSGKSGTTYPSRPNAMIYGDHEGEILWVGHENHTQGIQIGYNTIKKWHTDNGTAVDKLYFNVTGDTDMVIDTAGNVGIGTTHTQSLSKKLSIAMPNNTAQGYLGFYRSNSTLYGEFGYNSSFYMFAIENIPIRWGINNSEKMRLDTAGNLGIGTTGPKERLDVGNGKICFSGNLHSGTQGGISYYHSGQSTERKILFFDANGSTIIRSGDNSSSDGIKFQSYSGSTRMFIQDNGHVGIGHDPSYMLDVNGSVRFANCIWTQNSSNYGSVVLTGEKDGGYWGIQLGDSSDQPKIMSSGSNIGFYFDGTNEWGFYCDINAGAYMYYNGGCKLRTISNGVTVNGELYVDNWVRPSGNKGLYFQTHGGGWYMTDSTWIRSYNSKPVYINNWMCAEHVQCNSTSRSGNYVLRAHHSHSIGFYTESYLGSSGATNTSTTYTEAASAWFSGDIHVTSEVFVASDRRTKKDIEDVPDHNALEIVRNIPCRYYNYVDPQRNSENKSIGFIAQEVLPILPTAITIKKDFLPNRLEFIKIEEWIDIDDSDNSEYYYKLKSNLTDISGVLHRFICEDISNNKEIILEEVGNEDGTFNFPSKFDRIFCYGTEVDDFHVLDKSKIFALYHSSIQEIDRLQQADKAKIAELENKVVTIESELATIKQHLGI